MNRVQKPDGTFIESALSEEDANRYKEEDANRTEPIKSWSDEIEAYEKDPINNTLSKDAKKFYKTHKKIKEGKESLIAPWIDSHYLDVKKEYKIKNIIINKGNYEVSLNQNIDEINTHLLILKKEQEGSISIICTTSDIRSLKEYAKYHNKKTIKNFEKQGFNIKSKGIYESNFKGIKSIVEKFNATYTPTKIHKEIISITFKIYGYYYNISYFYNYEAQNIIDNIKISR